MGITVYCNKKQFHTSYKIWNQIKIYLGINGIKYLNELIGQHNVNDLKEEVGFLLENIDSSFSLNNYILFYEKNLQKINSLQLQGIYSFIKQNQLNYSYDFYESNNFINSINTIKHIIDSETDLSSYIDTIYDIHKYGIENNATVFVC